jgi:Protein of unknown function, DUF481
VRAFVHHSPTLGEIEDTVRILFFLLVPMSLCADQVVLTNGDTITGSIIKKDGNQLTLKSEFLGEVTMPWSAIKSLRADTAVTVVPATGEAVKGKADTSDGNLQVAAASGLTTLPLSSVTAVRNDAEQAAYERLLHPGILELWTGYVDLGLALTRGNAYTDTLTSAINATRVTRKNKIMVHVSQIYGMARVNGVTAANANAIRGGWALNEDVTPKLFINVFNDYEHDLFQNLDLRFVVGAGPGWNAIKTDRMQLGVSVGADYNRENFTSLSRNFAEANFGDAFAYRLSGITTVAQSLTFFPNLSESGEYRVNFDLGTVTTLKKWLSWQITGSDHFLSNPLVGRQRNDLVISTGFRVSFSRPASPRETK